jgi:hypothetical protein
VDDGGECVGVWEGLEGVPRTARTAGARQGELRFLLIADYTSTLASNAEVEGRILGTKSVSKIKKFCEWFNGP